MSIVLTAFCLIVCVGISSANAQTSAEYLEDLEDLRDPFVPQLPPPKIVPPVERVKQEYKPTEIIQTPQQSVIVQPKPVVAPVQPKKNNVSLVVKGLVWNTLTPQAIINDKIVQVGDTINDMKIVSIRSNGIEVLNNGQRMIINVTGKTNDSP